MSNNNAVYQVIKREYRSLQTNLARDLERQIELQAKLSAISDEVIRTRSAITELGSFARTQGWSLKDLESCQSR